MSELPKIAQQRLNAAAAKNANRESDGHPDANLLIGFVERNLAGVEREQVMAHLAVCSECREVVALSTPPLQEGGRHAVSRPESVWAQWKFLRFGAGTAVAAVIIAALVFFRVEEKSGPRWVATVTNPNEADTANARKSAENKPAAAESSQQPKQAAKEEHAAADVLSRGYRSTVAALDSTNGRLAKDKLRGAMSKADVARSQARTSSSERVMVAGASGSAPTVTSAGNRYDRLTQVSPQSETTASAERQPATGIVAGQVAMSAAIAPQAKASGGVAARAVSPDTARQQQSSASVEVQAATPVVEPSRSQQTSATDAVSANYGNRASDQVAKRSLSEGPSEQSVSNQSVMKSQGSAELRPQLADNGIDPDSPHPMWQVLGGRLQRGFGTIYRHSPWKDVALGNGAKFRVVVASNTAVGFSVWVGGNAGALYHSEDNGTNWKQVKGNWTSDIVSLRFNSLQQGQFETSTHEKWATTDAGNTWQKQ